MQDGAEGDAALVAKDTMGTAFTSETLRCLYACLALPRSASPEAMQRKMSAVNELLASFGARDGIEQALAAQAVAMHVGGMSAMQQASHPETPVEIASRLR